MMSRGISARGRHAGMLERTSHRLVVPIVWAILLVLAANETARAFEDGQQRRVLLISVDGLRPDAIDAADASVMLALIAAGSYQATCLNEMPPSTLPNHTSMVTGQRTARHRVYANTTLPGRVEATTIFDVAAEAGLGVGFFVSKGKLAYLLDAGAVRAWRITSDMDELTNEIIAAIQAEDMHLIFVHLGAPDGAGHRDGWMSDNYLAAVTATDTAIGRILDALDAENLHDETVVMVTADHGGHGGTHFLDIPEDRFIPFIINGPGIAPGRLLCEQIHVMDAAAMSLHVLGLPTASAIDGRVVTEASTDYDQPPCTPPEANFTILCGVLPPLFVIPIIAMLQTMRRNRRPCLL